MDIAGRRGRIWTVVPIVVLICGAGAWGVPALLAEYDNAPACAALTGEPASAPAGTGPVFVDVVRTDTLEIAAFLTDDHPNTTGYVLTPDRRGYHRPGDEPIAELAVSPDGTRIAVVPHVDIAPTDRPGGPMPGNRIGRYDVASGTVAWTPLPDDARSAAWSPDGRRLAVILGSPQSPVPASPSVVLVGGDATTVIAPTIDGAAPGDGPVVTANWQPDGRHLLLSGSYGTSVHTFDGAGRLLSPKELVAQGLSPDGTRGVAVDGSIIDLATGRVTEVPIFAPCQDHGIDRSFIPVGWYDDTNLLAVQYDDEWGMDHRLGEPKRPANGARLVAIDTSGRIGRVVVGWSVDLPTFSFSRRQPAA